ncbi:MAG: NAD(P)-binding domain-containing protein [Acidimicrobiales bacterium]
MGYHLARRDRPFVILDANQRIGDPWRRRWDSLRLFTPARYDGLPGFPYPARAWSFPSKDDMADYVESYAARFDLPVRTGVAVSRLVREGDLFVATAGDRGYQADNVVVATGGFQMPRVPALADELETNTLQLHSSQYRRPPNCGLAMSSWWVRPTRVPISLSNCHGRTGHGCRADTRAASPCAPEVCGIGCLPHRSGWWPHTC